MHLKNQLSNCLLVLKHYLTFWHFQRVFVYLFIDILAMSFVRRGKSNAVLIIKFDQLGDYIIARNLLRKVRDYPPYKERPIILCANTALKDFIDKYDADCFREVIWVSRSQMLNEIRPRFRILKKIKQLGPEIAIHPMYGLESFSGDCLMRASGARIRIGRSAVSLATAPGDAGVKLGDGYFTGTVDERRLIFDFFRNKILFSKAVPGLELPKNTRFDALPVSLPAISGPFAIIMPGASDAFREWPGDRFSLIANYLFETKKLRVIILGTEAESAKASALQKMAPPGAVENFCGILDLPQVVYLLSLCTIGITNDSGGIHLLAALNRPGIAISNGFSLKLFHPYPREVSESVSFVYPPALYEMVARTGRLEEIHKKNKYFPISDVTTEAVIARINLILEGKPVVDSISRLNDESPAL